jgi:hypothetical protein
LRGGRDVLHSEFPACRPEVLGRVLFHAALSIKHGMGDPVPSPAIESPDISAARALYLFRGLWLRPMSAITAKAS